MANIVCIKGISAVCEEGNKVFDCHKDQLMDDPVVIAKNCARLEMPIPVLFNLMKQKVEV